MVKRQNLFFLAALASSIGLSSPATSGQFTDFGNITALETGNGSGYPEAGVSCQPNQICGNFRSLGSSLKGDNTISVVLDVPFVNSNYPSPNALQTRPCERANTGYALDPKDPGVELHEAVLLSAFLSGKKVRLFVEGCIFGKPRIMAVDLGQPFP